ncbi:MAG TPA: hypothetical protein DEQ40_02645 [Oxalobacteraceae bacterium]|nr:hypothetical protein [Oxalobacteraceae bacterium]
MGGSHAYEFSHDDYDPTPQEPSDGPGDHRCGHAPSLEAAKAEIDIYEEENELAGTGRGFR